MLIINCLGHNKMAPVLYKNYLVIKMSYLFDFWPKYMLAFVVHLFHQVDKDTCAMHSMILNLDEH